MIIKSLNGKKIFSTKYNTARASLEYAVEQGIDLSCADLRRLKLKNANLDGLSAQGACFWGADLSGADIGFSSLMRSDLRGCNLVDTCFAESNLTDVDFRGASFSRTIFDSALLTGVKVSCPSFWACQIQGSKFKSLLYIHRGESEIRVSRSPMIISGPIKNLVIFDRHILWGSELYAEGSANI